MKQTFLLLATLLLLSIPSFAQNAPQFTPAGGGVAGTPGSGSTGAGAAPNATLSVSPNCPVANTNNCIHANANGQQENIATFSGSTVTISHGTFCNAGSVPCATGQSTSIGMVGWGVGNNCSTNSGIANQVVLPRGTITAVTSATVATMSTSASSSPGCFTWGNPDDAAISAAETIANNSPLCSSIVLSAGIYIIETHHVGIQPGACARLAPVFGANAVGGYGYAFGGSGQGVTRLIASPSFVPGTIGANLGSMMGNSAGQNGLWLHDFALDCAADGVIAWQSVNNANGLVHMPAYSKFTNVTFGPCGAGTTHAPGVGFDGPSDHMSYVTDDSFGAPALRNSATNGQLIVDHSSFQDAVNCFNSEAPAGFVACAAMTITGVGSSFKSMGGSYFLASSAGPTTAAIINILNGGVVTLSASDFVFDNGNTAKQVGVFVGTSSEFINNGAQVAVNDASTTGSTPVQNNQFVVSCSGSYIAPLGGSLAAFVNGSGASFFDECRNGFSQGSTMFTNSGVVTGSASIGFTPLVTGNVVISTCGTSAASLFSGSSTKGQFTITFAGTPTTACTMTVTFPAAFLAAPICTFSDQGGTQPTVPLFTLGAVSATSAASTEVFSAVWTAGDTEVIQYNCINP